MENVDLQYLCTVIGNLSGIPIRLFQGNRQLFYYALTALPVDPMTIYRRELWAIHTHVGYFVTPHFYYYGIVNSGERRIILGPTRQTPDNRQELRELAFQADVPPADVNDFMAGMQAIIRMPLESILQVLCTINFVLNDEKLELKDVTIYDAEQNDLRDTLQRQYESRRAAQISSEQPKLHNTLELEQAIMDIVRRGDEAALSQWIATAPAVRGGVLAADQLRQLKNTFIVTATLTSRAAIQGGLDVEEALSLSDAYIQRCELMIRQEQITNLQYHMVEEFTRRVGRVRQGNQNSRLAIEVSGYIRRHLSQPISTQNLADELFLSRPYLAARFKQETGETLTDFIFREKTEEAKRLLRYTDKSLTAIGGYLGFSSSSHFSRVFKKYAGYTPREYRRRYLPS